MIADPRVDDRRERLYRYDIDDVVEVVGFHRATLKLAFVRKGREVASITGELHVHQMRAAVRQAGPEARDLRWSSSASSPTSQRSATTYSLSSRKATSKDGRAPGLFRLVCRGLRRRCIDQHGQLLLSVGDVQGELRFPGTEVLGEEKVVVAHRQRDRLPELPVQRR